MNDNLNVVTVSALLLWPLVALWLYKTRPIGQATQWTILGAYMLLPVGAEIKLTMIPAVNKDSIAALAALFGCVLISGRPIRLWNGFGLAELLLLVLIICPFITGELNGDPIQVGPQVIPGVGSYDAGSEVIAQMILLIPFFLGRQILRSRADTEEILRVLVIAGLIYSLPVLFEIRFSPQLHIWLYGYFPHSFLQQMRDGGFRPVVFMGHGLLVSFFVCTTAVAATAFWRTNTRAMHSVRLPAGGITAYLSFVLLLCKTASALVYAVITIPLIYFTKPKMQIRVATLLVSLALLYPMLRAAHLVPTTSALDMASFIGPDRAGSLNDRFKNEEKLLEHAEERFLFGWGRFGRSFVYNKETGSIYAPDGLWIITMGELGFVGFLATFGLLALPVFAAARALRFAETPKDKVFLATVALILAINIFDLLPNSSLRPWTWLIAGSLLGRAEALRRLARVPKKPVIAQSFAHAETGSHTG
jgi:hypothetical protein